MAFTKLPNLEELWIGKQKDSDNVKKIEEELKKRSNYFLFLDGEEIVYMKNVAQEWLDREYPKNGVCLGEFDKVYEVDEKNKGKKKEEITKLIFNIDPWEDEAWVCKCQYINNGYRFCEQCGIERKEPEEQKWLIGFLKLEGFINLEKLECYEKKLTSLEVIDSPKLKEFSFADSNFNLVLNDCPFLEKLFEKNTKLQGKVANYQNQISHLMARLSELETTFDQQLKTKKNDWKSQIKEKKSEIISTLSRKGNNSQIHKEVRELQDKISNYEKLVQELQKARSIMDNNVETKELAKNKDSLDGFYQKLQKDESDNLWKGTCKVLKEITKHQEEIERKCEEFENSGKEKIVELRKLTSMGQKLIQKLLGNQQFQTNIETPPKSK